MLRWYTDGYVGHDWMPPIWNRFTCCRICRLSFDRSRSKVLTRVFQTRASVHVSLVNLMLILSIEILLPIRHDDVDDDGARQQSTGLHEQVSIPSAAIRFNRDCIMGQKGKDARDSIDWLVVDFINWQDQRPLKNPNRVLVMGKDSKVNSPS